MADFQLLAWATARTRGHDNVDPVDNIKEAWGNGLAWCALLYAYFPEKIPQMKSLDPKTEAEHIECCKIAFGIATEAGCEPYLDPEDVVLVQDKKSILVYLSEIYNITKTLPVKFQSSPEWEANWERKKKEEQMARFRARREAEKNGGAPAPAPKAGGKMSLQEKLAAQRAAEEAEEEKAAATRASAAVSAVSTSSGPTEAQKAAAERALATKKAEEEALAKKKKEAEDKAAADKAAAAAAAEKKRQEAVAAAAAQPSGSPPSPAELEGDLTFSTSGKGSAGGPAKAMLIFTVQFKVGGKAVSGTKDDLKIYIDSPSKNVPRINIMGGTGGSYNIGFTPDEPGQWWIDFVFHGKWCDKPFCLNVKNPFNKTPDHTYTGPERAAAGK